MVCWFVEAKNTIFVEKCSIFSTKVLLKKSTKSVLTNDLKYSNSNQYIEQFYVYGESTDSFIVGILVPELNKLKTLLSSHGIHLKDIKNEELKTELNKENVKKIVLQEIDNYIRSHGGKGYEIVKNIYIETEPFTEENGLMTPSFKMRRPDIKNHYADILKQLRSEQF